MVSGNYKYILSDGKAVVYGVPDEQKDNFSYVRSDDHITINSYTGTNDPVVIPETIDGLPVTEIKDYAFEGGVTSEIIIPANVEKLGYNNTNIFGTCNGLRSVTVDENNKYFCSDDGILYSKDKTRLICYPGGKTQKNFVVPENVSEICCRAFYQCENLADVKISGDCCTLSDCAFYFCPGLVCVDIGKSEGVVNRLSFNGCPLLSKIEVSDDNKAYVSNKDMLLSKDRTGLIFYFPGYEEDECIVPDSVKKIHEFAFSDTQNLKTLVLSEGIKTIDENIFSINYSIEKIILPDSLTTIEYYIFQECRSLTYVEFGKKLTDINLLNWIGYSNNIRQIVIKNPECTFPEKVFNHLEYRQNRVYNVTVYSYKFSDTEELCKQYRLNFIEIDEENDDVFIYGDLDGDKSAELSDFVLLSIYLLGDMELDRIQKNSADVEPDGCIDISDLTTLKQYIMKDDIKLGK